MPSLPRPLLVIVACLLLVSMAAPLLSAQPLPPYLKMHSPSDGDVVSGDVTVTFTASDNHPYQVDLYVDGLLVQSAISSPHTIPGLADGWRTITLVAINIHGSYDTESALILIDSTPPVVEITHPFDGQVVDSRSFPLNYTVEEENPSRTMYRIDDGGWVSLTGNITLDVPHDGNYSITVRAVDVAGNADTETVDFTVDTGMPVIRFISPEHNSYLNTSDVTVNWTAYNYDHLNYSLDGGPWQPAPADGVELLGLDNGRHTIVLQGSNANGIDERSLSFYVDDELPELTIIAPLPDMRFGTTSVMVLWDVVNDSPYHSDLTVTVDGVKREYAGVSGTSLRISGLPAGHAVLNITVNDLAGNSMEANVSFHVGVQGLPLGAVSASNDDSLSSLVQHMGLPGNGSYDDPYIFDNIGFDAQGADYAVKVEHTSKHIVFSNLSLFNTKTVNGDPAGSGLFLKDTKNIIVRDCVIIGQMHGIRSDSISHNLTITANDLRHSHRGAVTVEQGYNLTITDNDCRNAGRWAIKAGWELTESRGVNVSGNDGRDHQRFGLALERVNGGTVDGNIVTTSAEHDTIGIYLYNTATDTTIRDNDCRFNDKGILLTGGAHGNTITANDCRNNTYGIEIADWSERNNISENDCRENPYGIYLNNANYNIVRDNNCSQTNNSIGIGIYVQGGSSNLIQDNNASGNLLGIHADRSSSQVMRGNDCRDAGEHAILISGRPYGHQIIDNDCRFAALDAIRMESDNNHVSSNVIEANDCRFNGGSGLNISTTSQYNVTNNRISGNDLRSSVYDMIRIEGGNYSHNRFIGNILSDAPMMPINLISSSSNYDNTTVQGNQLQNSSTQAFRLHGNLTHLYILDNLAHNATGDGINVTDSLDGMSHIFIDGNDVSDSGGDGIYLRSNSHIEGGSVSSNTVLRSSGLQIQVLSSELSFFNIDDNTASGHPLRPITVPAAYLEDVSISGNDLRDSGEGILLRERILLNVTVSYNDLRSTPGTLIELNSTQSARGLHVDGNDLRRDNGRGIWVDVNGLSDSTFNDNLLQLLVDEPLTIHSPYLHDVQVDGNQCPSASDNGLSIHAAEVRGLSVSANHLNDSGGDGLRLVFDIVDDLRVNHNIIDDSSGYGVIVISDSHINILEIGHNSLNRSGSDSISVTAATALEDVLIDHNHCNATGYPIMLRAGTMTNVTVHANNMHHLQNRPLLLDTDHLDRITVSDNMAPRSPDHGVEMNGTLVRDIVISGNELGGSMRVPIQVTSPNTITGIRVADNNASGLDLHGILIETPMSLSDVSIEGNTLIGNLAEQMVLRCDSLTDASVSENIAPNSPRIPLLLECEAVNGLVIRDNIFNDSGGHGVQVDVDSMLDVVISGNLLHGSAQDAINISVVHDATNVVIEGNDCSDAAGNGIILTADRLRDILIDGNVMTDVGLDPIIIAAVAAYDTKVSNNTCPNARGTPVSLSIQTIDGLTIHNNMMDGSGSHGVDVEAAMIRNLSVTDNSLTDAMGDGVRVVMTSPGSLQQLLIGGNDVRNAAGNGINLIAESMNHVTVSGNDLRNVNANAFSSISQLGMGNLTLKDNDCRFAAQDGLKISDETKVQDFLISGNDITSIGRHPIPIDAPIIAQGVIEENLCQGSARPLMLHGDQIIQIRIIDNNLSNGGEALRIDGNVDTLDVIGNDMTGSYRTAVVINAVGDATSITIRDNAIGADMHGIRLDAGRVSDTLVRNNSVTAAGHPLWIIADSSESLLVMENDFSAAASLPIRLDIPFLNNTLIEGNDMSGSILGIEIHTQSISGLSLLSNDLSDCGSGINVSATGTISSIVISDNIMTGVPGFAILVHSDSSIDSLDILANEGDAEDVSVTAQSLMHGNISGNLMQGSITVDVSNGLLLSSIDDNVLIGGISLNASDVSVDSISGNNASHMQVASAGDVLLNVVNGNVFAGGVSVSAASDCTINAMEANSIGSTEITAVTLTLGSFSHNGIDPAGDALLITADRVTVQSISHNTIADCNHRVFAVIAPDTIINAIDSNTLVSGSPQHLLLVLADDALIRSVDGNVMDVLSTSEAVRIESALSLEATITNNVFEGGIHISAANATVTVDRNNVNGTMTLTGTTLNLPSVSGNSLHDAMINGTTHVRMDLVDGNTLRNLTVLSVGTIVVDAMTSNNLSGHAYMACGHLEIGNADDNRLSRLLLDGHDSVTIGGLDRNHLTTAGGAAVNIISSGPVQISSFSDNTLDASSPSLLLDVHSTQLTMEAMDGNSIMMSSTTAVNLSVTGTVTIHSFSFNELMDGDVVISCVASDLDTIVDNVFGNMLLDVESLDMRLFQGNTLDNLTVVSVGSVDMRLLHDNSIANLSIDALEASLNLTFNTMDNVTVNLTGSLDMDVMSVNALSYLTVQANEVNIGTVEWNTMSGAMEIRAGGSLHASVIKGNHMTDMTLNASGDLHVGTAHLNTLVSDMMFDSGGDIFIGAVQENSLRHLNANATALLNISSIVANDFHSAIGDVILLEAQTLNITEVWDNTVVSGAPETFLTIIGDDLFLGSVSANTMTMASSADAIHIVTASYLETEGISNNHLNGDVTMQSIDVRVGTIDANRLKGLSITADALFLNTVTDNDCETGLFIKATEMGMMEAFSGNSMASLTMDVLGNLSIGTFHGNDCSGPVSLNGNTSVTLGSLAGNIAVSFEIHSDGMMSLGPVTGNGLGTLDMTASELDVGDVTANTLGPFNITVLDDCIIGTISNNSIERLDISSGDLRILAVTDNIRLGTVVIHCAHLVIVEGISGNHIPEGLWMEASSALALHIGGNMIDEAAEDGVSIDITSGIVLNMVNNVVTDCGRHGINLQSAGDVDLISAGDVIDAADVAIMVRAGGEASLSVSSLHAQGGNGIDADSLATNVVIRDSVIASAGYGISLPRTSSLSVENVTFDGNLNGIHCPVNLALSIIDSSFVTNTIGVNVTGGTVDIRDNIFEGSGLALFIDGATVLFEDNRISNSSTDGLRLHHCDQVIVRNNSFVNNTGFAINASGCTSSLVVWNEFRDNNGATSSYHPDRAQCRDDNNNTWSASRYEGSGGTEGNHWSDWQSPDENGDGIVDDPYVLSGNAIDEHPLVGLTDLYPPYLNILGPEDGSKHSFDVFVLSWEAMDNRSGISLYDVEVLVDDVLFATLPPDQTSLGIDPLQLDEGYRTIIVSVRDNDGNHRNESVTILVDRTPPTIEITHPSGGDVLTTPFDLQWDVEDEYDPVPRTDISWDGDTWTTDITSPYQIDGLEDGEYTIHLRAVDHLGNMNHTQVTFIIDNTPPVVEITSPTDGDFINSSEVTLAWTVEDDNPDFVEVSSNGMDWILAQDIHTFTLSDGGHTLQVRATDMAGNVNVSVVNITVDTEPPRLEIVSPDEGEHLDDGDVSMVFNVTDTNILEVQVSRDGVLWVSPDDDEGHLFTGLDDGEVTLHLRAVDKAGNVNMTNVTVVVDTVAPIVTIDSPPDGYHTNSTALTVSWTVIESSPYSAEVSYDDVEWNAADDTHHHVFDLIGEGEHVLLVMVTDAAGNQNKTNVTVILDMTAPLVTITSPSDGSYNSTGTVHLTWEVVEDNYWTAAVSIDGSPWQELGQVTEHTLTDMEDGDRGICVKVTDQAGNHATDLVTVHVDSSEPELTITSPEEGGYIPSEDVLVQWIVEDDSPVVMEISYDGIVWAPSDDVDSHTFLSLDEGENELWVRATDAAGNGNVSSVNVIVDTVPPELTIDSPADGFVSDHDEVLVEWTVNESSPYTVDVSYDNVTWVPADSPANHTFTLQDGENELHVRVTDAAGNSNISSVTVHYAEPAPSLLQEEGGMPTVHFAAVVGAAVIGGAYFLLRPRRLF